MNQSVTSLNVSLLFFIFLSGFVIVNGLNQAAGPFNWLSIILSSLIGAVLLFGCLRLLKLYQKNTIFEVFQLLLGRYLGGIINFLYSMLSILMSTIMTNLLIEFLHLTALRNTASWILSSIFCIVCIVCVCYGMEAITRVAYFMCPFALLSIVLSISLSINTFDFTTISLERIQNFSAVLYGAENGLNRIYAQIFYFIAAISLLKRPKKFNTPMWISYIVTTVFIAAIVFKNIAVLGFEIASKFYFPSYAAAGILQLGELFERMELLISSIFIATGTCQVIVFLVSACAGMAAVFHANYKTFSIPFGILIWLLSLSLFDSTMSLFNFINQYSPYFFLCTALVPLCIWPVAEIQMLIKRIKGSQNCA